MTRIIALLLMCIATMARADAPSPALAARAESVVAMLRDATVDEADFAPAFLAQVPAAQVAAVAKNLRAANGPVIGLTKVDAEGALQGVATIDYAQAIVTVRLAIETDAPHRFIGLLITGVARKNDSLDAIATELRAVPGHTGLLVARLERGAVVPLVAHNADQPFAVASQFKLVLLAELARAVQAGERRWADVVPLGPPSLPSGVMQDWPRATPVTLATLATQTISISDNTAADTLLNALGRDKVDAMRASVGTTPGALPVLATREAFVLKMDASGALRTRWTGGTLAERRALLARESFDVSSVDARQLGYPPALHRLGRMACHAYRNCAHFRSTANEPRGARHSRRQLLALPRRTRALHLCSF